MILVRRPCCTLPCKRWRFLDVKLRSIYDYPSCGVPLLETRRHPLVHFWPGHPHWQLLELDIHQVNPCCEDSADSWRIDVKPVCKVFHIQSQSQPNHHQEKLLLKRQLGLGACLLCSPFISAGLFPLPCSHFFCRLQKKIEACHEHSISKKTSVVPHLPVVTFEAVYAEITSGSFLL